MKIKRLKGELLLDGFNINANGGGGSGGGSDGGDNFNWGEGIYSTKNPDGTISTNSGTDGNVGYGNIFGSEGPSQTKTADGTITTDEGGEVGNQRFSTAIDDYQGDLNLKKGLSTIGNYKDVATMINPALGLASSVLGMFGKMMNPDFDKSFADTKTNKGPGNSLPNQRGDNSSGHNNGDIQTDTQKAQTEEATSSEETDETTSISSGDLTLQAEAAAEAARAEERAKARKRVGLYSMRHTDPFGMFDLPDIFTPGGYA